jgi:hypothetical protein
MLIKHPAFSLNGQGRNVACFLAEEINRLDAQRCEEYDRVGGDGDLSPTRQAMAEIHAELRQ